MLCFGAPGALSWLSSSGVHADSVELKTLLATPARRAAEHLTAQDVPAWRTRRIYLIDTADMALLRAGVNVRLRRRAHGRHDLSVRTRRWGADVERPTPRRARVEFDVLPGAMWETVEVRRAVDSGAAGDVIAGVSPPGTLLSPDQRTWALEGRSGLVDGDLTDLRVYGPLVVERLKVPRGRSVGLRRLRLEHCRYPSDRELVEVSVRCRPEEVGAAARAFSRLLDERDVEVAAFHRTKTAVWHDELAP